MTIIQMKYFITQPALSKQIQAMEQTKDHVVIHKDHPIRDTFRDIFLKNEGESQVEQTKK